MKIPGSVILYGVAAIVIGAVAWYAVRKVNGALPSAEDVKEALDPTSENNLAYRALNTVTRIATGNDTDTFGTWLASGKSDAVGAEAVKPYTLRPGALVIGEYVGDLPLASEASTYVGDLPLATDRLIIDGSGGAAFGLYPNPFRSKQ